jgi:photosystem II stability/assembly factor-like uncharacterized protein
MTAVYLGTTNGVCYLNNGGLSHLGLERERISAIHTMQAGSGNVRILAGSYESGLFRSDDYGEHWQEVADGFWAMCVRWIGNDPLNPGQILAGTEPGRIFRTSDNGDSWSELEGIKRIEGHENWFLPYSPRSGAVRNIYAPAGSNRYLASVEVGGLLESDDNGKTWSCRHIGFDSDIHFVTGHPNNGELLFAALGYAGIEQTPNEDGTKHRGGLARSTDGGRTWTKLFGDYTRAVIVPPTRTDLVIAGPSPDVGRNGRIEVSRDAGDTWEDASSGIDLPMSDMVEVFVPAPGDSIWAICSGGRLLQADPNELVWENVLGSPDQVQVQSVAFA